MKKRKTLTTRNVALIGMLGALAGVLMLFEMPLPFIAPPFYELDLSEIPVLIGTFALGPLAGVLIELVKILVKLMLKSTSTAFVGDFANFVFGCALILPAGLIYRSMRSKRGALIGMAVGTVSMVVVGTIGNALVMLPFYSQLYGMPMETILAAGKAINPAVGNVWSFVLICVVPFNLIKGTIVSVITALIYKRVSPLIRSVSTVVREQKQA